MASGDTLSRFTARACTPPANNPASLDTRNAHCVLNYDDTTAESALFEDVMPRNYAGGGITVTLQWMGKTAVAGGVRWQAQFERLDDESTDLDADSFAAVQEATGTAPGTSGQDQYTAISFSSAQIDGILAGEGYRLKVLRSPADAADTMLGDAQLLRLEVKET